MPTTPFPSVAELLPHRGPAVLLDRVLAHDERETVCLVRVDASALFAREDGSVPAWIGLEYMAQTIAAHGGLLDRRLARPPRPGLFLGSRRLTFAADRFERGAMLRAHARPVRGAAASGSLAGGSRMMAFECALHAGDADSERPDVLVSGILNVYLVDDLEALHAQAPGRPDDVAD